MFKMFKITQDGVHIEDIYKDISKNNLPKLRSILKLSGYKNISKMKKDECVAKVLEILKFEEVDEEDDEEVDEEDDEEEVDVERNKWNINGVPLSDILTNKFHMTW